MPKNALNVEIEQALWERVFEHGDTTCLVVSHRKAALKRALEDSFEWCEAHLYALI